MEINDFLIIRVNPMHAIIMNLFKKMNMSRMLKLTLLFLMFIAGVVNPLVYPDLFIHGFNVVTIIIHIIFSQCKVRGMTDDELIKSNYIYLFIASALLHVLSLYYGIIVNVWTMSFIIPTFTVTYIFCVYNTVFFAHLITDVIRNIDRV